MASFLLISLLIHSTMYESYYVPGIVLSPRSKTDMASTLLELLVWWDGLTFKKKKTITTKHKCNCNWQVLQKRTEDDVRMMSWVSDTELKSEGRRVSQAGSKDISLPLVSEEGAWCCVDWQGPWDFGGKGDECHTRQAGPDHTGLAGK